MPEEAWKKAKEQEPAIKRIVNAAIYRLAVPPDQRDDAIQNSMITAYEIAQRDDVKDYPNLVARTVKWNLFRDGTRPSSDAMDHSRRFQEITDPDSGEDAESEKVEEEFPSPEEATPLEPDVIKHLIETRVPANLWRLAEMAFLEHRTPKRIANSTGRTLYDVNLRLMECRKLMWGRKNSKTSR